MFRGLFEKDEKVHGKTQDCVINETNAYCGYRRTAHHKDGTTEEYLSVDILSFKDGLIVHKDTYFKQRT